MTIPSYQPLASNKHSSLSVHKNYHVLMVQSTNIASSYLYQFLLFLAHAGKSQLSFLFAAKYKLANQKPYNPLRKPPPPHKTPRETASHAAQYYTTPIKKRNFQSKSHSQKRDMLLTFTNPSDSHIFTSLKMSIPIKKLLR